MLTVFVLVGFIFTTPFRGKEVELFLVLDSELFREMRRSNTSG